MLIATAIIHLNKMYVDFVGFLHLFIIIIIICATYNFRPCSQPYLHIFYIYFILHTLPFFPPGSCTMRNLSFFFLAAVKAIRFSFRHLFRMFSV